MPMFSCLRAKTVIWSAIVLLAMAYRGTAAPANIEQQFRDAAASVQADLAALSTDLYSFIGKLAAKQPVERIRFTCPKAVGGRDLTIDLFRSKGDWIAGLAYAPQWNSAVHFVKPDELALSGTIKSGSLKGTLGVTLVYDGAFPLEGKSIAAMVTLNGKTQDGRASGSFSFAGGKSLRNTKGSIRGTASAIAGAVTQPVKLTPVNLGRMNGYHLYATSVTFERNAEILYQNARAIVLAASYKIRFREAARHGLGRRPARPEFVSKRKKLKKKASKPKAISLDDVDLDMGDLGNEGGKDDEAEAVTPVAEHPGAKQALARMQDMCDRVARMRAAASRQLKAGLPKKGPVTVDQAPGDPMFGPWLRASALPKAGSRNSVPAVAASGGQKWAYVDTWKVSGPFPRSLSLLHIPLMPDVIESRTAEHVSGFKGLAAPGDEAGDKPPETQYVKWLPVKTEPGTGRVRLPGWQLHTKVGREGTPALAPVQRCSFYARAELTAPADMETWICLLADQYGRFWVNDELVCAGPPSPSLAQLAPLAEKFSVLGEQQFKGFDWGESRMFARVRLKKGVNNLLLRCDNDIGPMTFGAHICTEGAPRAGIAGKVQTKAEPLPPDTRGWRGQWNGLFPDAKPPLAWDLGKRINILWRAPIPMGNSGVVVTGDRLVTQTEPHGIVCVDKKSGKILWQRECNVLDLIDKSLLPEYEKLHKAHADADAAIRKLGPEREAQLAALQKQGLSGTQAEQKLSKMEHDAWQKWRAYDGFFKEKGRIADVPDAEHTGYAMPTPATDGKHVYCKFGTAVAACFDLDGNRKWMVRLGDFASSRGMLSSPLLLDNRLIVAVHIRGKDRRAAGTTWMKGLDPATGKETWSTKVSGSNTPVPMRLSNGSGVTAVAVSSGGHIVRAADGKVVGYVPQARFGGGPPTPSGDRLYYWAPGRATAVRLLMYDGDHVGARLLWDRHELGPYGSPRSGVAGGHVFGYRSKGGDHAVEILDAATGERVKSLGQIFWSGACGGTIPMSTVGGLIYHADDGSSHNRKNPRTSPGSLSVIQPWVRGQIIARNKIERMGSAPIFDGDRIYLRAREAMMCIGYTGDKGRSYEAQALAAGLADWIYPEKPIKSAPLTIAAVKVKGGHRSSLPVADPAPWSQNVTWHQTGPQPSTRSPMWLFAGPWPLAEKDAVRESLGDLKKFSTGLGKPMGPAGKQKTFGDLGIRFMKNRRTSYRLDLLGPLYGEAGTVSYYFTSVNVTEPYVYRMELTPRNVRLWLNGVEVKHQQRVRLDEGAYRMLLEVSAPKPLPDRMLLSLQFWRSNDQAEELRLWEADVRRNLNILNDAYAWANGSEIAGRAEALLRAMPDWQPPKIAFRVEKEDKTKIASVKKPVVLGEANDTRVEWRNVDLKLKNAFDLRLKLRDGKWDPVCSAWNVRLGGRFGRRHSGTVEAEEKKGDVTLTLKLELAVHGRAERRPAAFTVKAKRAGDGKLAGTYAGEFGGKQYRGDASGHIHHPWPGLVKNWKPVAPGEHPRLLFRRDDLPALRKKAETPEGKAIIRQLKKLLENRFTNGHPAGYGFLYHITGEEIYARKCKGMLDELLAGRCGVDGRYHFANPNGQLRAGPSIGVAAMAYDLGYDIFDEAYRQKVANRILNHKMTEEIVNAPRHGAGCNHYGAHQGGIGVAMLAIRGDPGVDNAKVEKWLKMVLDSGPKGGMKAELDRGFSKYGYYYEGHHCGRISKTGVFPFVHALQVAAGLDCTYKHTNTAWLLSRWVYEFVQVDGKCRNIQRGMYARPDFKQYSGWSGDGDFAMGFGFTPQEHKGALKWAYNHLVEPDPAKREYSAWRYGQLGAWAFVTWPIGIEEQNPIEVFPRVHYDPDPGYFVFRNDWTGTEKDVIVTALLGSKPRNGRGMAQGGSVEVLGMGLNTRFPGAFFHDRVTYFKAEKDGSGVLSAEPLAQKVEVEAPPKDEKEADLEKAMTMDSPPADNPLNGLAAATKKKGSEFHEAVKKFQQKDRITALAVDYSGKCGAPVLIVMTGRMLGKGIGTWMTIHDAGPTDVKGSTGAYTRTTGLLAGGRPYYVMTVQKGKAPPVKAVGDRIAVGGLTLHFDGEKMVMAK